MKRFLLIISAVILALTGGVSIAKAEDEVEKSQISAADIKDGLKVYISSALKESSRDFTNFYMIAHPESSDKNALMINENLTSETKDAATWTLIATNKNDAIFTDKPTYYLFNESSNKYFGSSLANGNSGNNRLVDSQDKAYAFCFLTAEDIAKTQPTLHAMVTYGNDNAVFIHCSIDADTWFRIARNGNITYVDNIQQSNTTYHNTYGTYMAMLVYSTTMPNNEKAAEGIAALQSTYDEIKSYYDKMTSSTYDDVAFTEEQENNLADALDNAKTALDDTPSGDNSYYTDLQSALQTVYEKVPYVEGGTSRWLISVDSIKDGREVIFQLSNTQYPNYMVVSNPYTDGSNAVMVNAGDKSGATVWKLVAANTTDAYTGNATYYLMDTATGKYLGTSGELSNTSNGAYDGTAKNYKKMVLTTDSAYKFSVNSVNSIITLDNKNTGKFGNDDAVIIQYSYDADNWFRLARFGGYAELRFLGQNDNWTAWNMYCNDADYRISSELSEAINTYGNLILVAGSNPGEYPDTAAVKAYQGAVAAANGVSETTTRAQIRSIIDNLKAQYDVAALLQANPVTTGYYYIVSAWNSTAAYDPQTDTSDPGNVKLKAQNSTDKSQIFYITETEDGSGEFNVQNFATSRYIGARTSDSYVPYYDTPLDNTYHKFIYHTQGQFNWIATTDTYYFNPNGSNLNATTQGKTASSNTDWYLRPVPQYIIEQLNGTATYTDTNNNLAATGTISAAGLQSALEAYSDVTSIDLTAATLPADLTGETLNAMMSGNQVATLPSGSTLEGNNLIIDGTCANLALTDKLTFAPATSFTATKATISRKLYSGLNTVCLPFAFSAANIGVSGAKIYAFTTNSDNTVTFTETTEAEAGLPVLVWLPEDASTSLYGISASNVEIQTVALADRSVVIGTFTTITPGEGCYKLSQDGTEFVQTTESSTVLPFRFYLKPRNVASDSFRLVLNDDDDPTGLNNAAAEDYTLKQISAIYDSAGHRLQSPKKGINIFRYADGSTQKVYIK